MTRRKPLYVLLVVVMVLSVMALAVGSAAACEPGPHGEMVQVQVQHQDGSKCAADGAHCQIQNQLEDNWQSGEMMSIWAGVGRSHYVDSD
jgi:hypothetical protein